MKYFIVEDSLDEKVVGKDFPQAYKFIKGYNPDAPNMLFSIYKSIWGEKRSRRKILEKVM